MSEIKTIFGQSLLAEAAYADIEPARQPDGSYRKDLVQAALQDKGFSVIQSGMPPVF